MKLGRKLFKNKRLGRKIVKGFKKAGKIGRKVAHNYSRANDTFQKLAPVLAAAAGPYGPAILGAAQAADAIDDGISAGRSLGASAVRASREYGDQAKAIRNNAKTAISNGKTAAKVAFNNEAPRVERAARAAYALL